MPAMASMSGGDALSEEVNLKIAGMSSSRTGTARVNVGMEPAFLAATAAG